MKRPALVILALYALILLVFTLPAWYAAHGGEHDAAKLLRRYQPLGYAIWFVLMVGCQAALLLIPVRVASRQPVSKRHVGLTVAAAALAMATLVYAATLCVVETVGRDDALYPGLWKESLALAALSWFGWAWLFRHYATREHPARFSAPAFPGLIELMVPLLGGTAHRWKSI